MKFNLPYILAISGSASRASSNLRILEYLSKKFEGKAVFEIFDELQTLPHFSAELTIENTPSKILEIREKIRLADGIIICTPEYIFSMPAGLKNLLEWCVSTVLFTNKPAALITASASGEKGKEELELIMKTLGAEFSEKNSILIASVKNKIDKSGIITDAATEVELNALTDSFIEVLKVKTLNSL